MPRQSRLVPLFVLLSIVLVLRDGRAAENDAATGPQLVTHLYTSWYGVDAGVVVFKVDRSQVDPDALEVLEQVKGYYKIELTDGDSPPKRVNVPAGVKVRAEVATKSAPWLLPEKPWEQGDLAALSVIQDGGRIRVWYACPIAKSRDKAIVAPNGKLKLGSEGGASALCYQESSDGFRWEKPALGLVEFQGSKDNNIVTTDTFLMGGSIFLDPTAPAAERYKLVTNTDIRQFEPAAKGRTVLGGAVSPDGIHWTRLPEPFWKESFNNDGSPCVHRDAQTGQYVMFTRANFPRRRSIARAETDDFRRWTHPRLLLTPGPDEDPADDFYDNPYLFYPGSANGHLMLVSTYHRDTSLVDMRLASSMDGDGWNWLSPRTVVPLGQPGAWDGGMLFAVPDMVRLGDGRVGVAIHGTSSGHEEHWRTKFEKGRAPQQASAWAMWEDGRVAGIEVEKRGEFTTLPLRATGQPIQLSARTNYAGSLRVEVFIDGEPEQRVRQTSELTGDLRWQPLTWEEGDLQQLAGKTIRLRFHLYNAKVFGIRGEGLEYVSSYTRK